MTDQPQTIQDMIEEYIELRDWKEAEEKHFEEDMKKKVGNRMREIENIVLTHMNANGNTKVGKAGRGVAYTQRFVSCRTEDMNAFRRHVIGTQQWDLADWKPNKTLVTEIIDGGGTEPPGVKWTPTTVVRFRKD